MDVWLLEKIIKNTTVEEQLDVALRNDKMRDYIKLACSCLKIETNKFNKFCRYTI